MWDPVLKYVQAERVKLLFSHPEAGCRLSSLTLREVKTTVNGIEVVGGELHYVREVVKSLTVSELSTRLVMAAEAAEALLIDDENEPAGAQDQFAR